MKLICRGLRTSNSVRGLLVPVALLIAVAASARGAPPGALRAQVRTPVAAWRVHGQERNPSAALLRAWDGRYAKVGRTAASTLASAKPDRQALRVYLLERELVDLLKYVDRSKNLSSPQRELVSRDIIARLGQLQHSYTTIQGTMRARVEARSAGVSGGTVAKAVRGRQGMVDLYQPTKGKRYADVVAKREKEHPGEEPYFHLNRKTIGSVKSGELLEFGATKGNHLRVTRFAKHLDVGNGKGMAGAGGTKIFWSESSRRRKAILAYGSNWSGTYQPDMATLAHTLLPRFDKLGIDRSVVVLTPSMPLSTKIYETLLETRGVDKEVAKTRAARLQQLADLRTTHLEQRWGATLAPPSKLAQ